MQSRRIDLEREISIRVPAFDSFVTEYSANVSTTGMFIRSDKPLPPDTKLSFEFRVADEWKLIRGKANVVWSRYQGEGAVRPAGMGVLFTELDSQSRRLIQWIIEKHVRDGGTPFDLGELKESYESASSAPVETEGKEDTPPSVTRVIPQQRPIANRPPSARKPAERPKPAPPEPLRFRLAPLIAAGALLAGVLGLLFWASERGAQSAANPDLDALEVAESSAPERASETPADSAQASDDQAAEPTSASSDAASRTARPTRPVDESSSTTAPVPQAEPEPAKAKPAAPRPASRVFDEVAKRTVTTWASDWSSQDVDKYLSHYARDFKPTSGQSRSAWATNRRARLVAPEFIDISISGMETAVVDGTRGRVTFNQVYRSNTYEDSVRKALVLVREDDRWKILQETTLQ